MCSSLLPSVHRNQIHVVSPLAILSPTPILLISPASITLTDSSTRPNHRDLLRFINLLRITLEPSNPRTKLCESMSSMCYSVTGPSALPDSVNITLRDSAPGSKALFTPGGTEAKEMTQHQRYLEINLGLYWTSLHNPYASTLSDMLEPRVW
jgi:hypothetical protein